MTDLADALRELLDALPHCSACDAPYAPIVQVDRWPLCRACYDRVPPTAIVHDLTRPITRALLLLSSPNSPPPFLEPIPPTRPSR